MARTQSLEDRTKKTITKTLLPSEGREIPVAHAAFIHMARLDNLLQSFKNIYYHLTFQHYSHTYESL